MKLLNDSTVAVVGMGLMGGSLALALKKNRACARILAITPEESVRASAAQIGAVDAAGDDLELVADADIIIIATPVRVILDQLAPIGRIAKDGALILDLGSTKEQIVTTMATLPSRLEPIGGHPMCGKEQSGFGAADADLFRGAVFALTPLSRTSPATLSRAKDLVSAIGARPVIMDAAQHDRIVAAVSHLPFLLAVALIQTASGLEASDYHVLELAASGFRDTSRLAASDTTMMLDILATNRVNIAQQVRDCSSTLECYATLIESGDEETMHSVLEQAAASRRILRPGARL